MGLGRGGAVEWSGDEEGGGARMGMVDGKRQEMEAEVKMLHS